MDPDGDRLARQSANLARHLNDRHPDTVLFLARHAAGRIGATSATVLAADATGLALSVESPGGADDRLLPFEPATGPGDVRQLVAQLLLATRAALPPGSNVPLTSLEAQHRSASGGHRQ